jgi:MraZ protein
MCVSFPAPEGAPTMFLGEYEHSLDSKQRLAIPVEVRNEWKPERHGSMFIAAPGQTGGLWLWPEKKFEEYADRIESGLVTQEEVARRNRQLFSRAARVPFDSSGRVRIADRLLQEYGLSDTVVILGVRDHLELTTREQRAREVAASESRE